MAREARILVEDGIYHVTARGNRRQVIFADNADYQAFETTYFRILKRMNIQSHAHVQMSNHVHFILQDPEGALSVAMRDLLGWYAQYYNGRHGMVGHLFQGRFYSAVCRSEEQFDAWVYYVHDNPVRAGLVEQQQDYRWSSAFKRCSSRVNLSKNVAHYEIDWRVRDLATGICADHLRCLRQVEPYVRLLHRLPAESPGQPEVYRRIIRLLCRYYPFSKSDLAQHFGVSVRTVRRYLDNG